MGRLRSDEDRMPDGRDWRDAVREAGPYLGLGAQLAGAMFIFVFGGYLLDGWLGTAPWLTIAGAALGMVAVFTQIFRAGAEIEDSQAKPKGTQRNQRLSNEVQKSAGKRRKMDGDGRAKENGGSEGI